MGDITLRQAKKILKEIEEVKEKTLKKGKRCDYRTFLPIIEKYGFLPAVLGTSYNNYICSSEAKIMDVKSKKFLNGKFLVIGVANEKRGRGIYYKGFVLEIK